MSWRYAAVKETVQDGEVWTVREVYDIDGETANGYTANPTHAQGSSRDVLIKDLVMMLADVSLRPAFEIKDGQLDAIAEPEV